MQKIIFLFQRKAPQTHAEFGAHYLDHHAPLGLKVAVQMDGYTVNLVPDEASGDFDLDAVTETWTPSVEAFMDPQRAFANEADMTELMTDPRISSLQRDRRVAPRRTCVAFSDEEQARAFEQYLKTQSGRAFAKKRL